MSYTFLLEQGEESSAESFSGIAPCALSNSNPPPAECCSPASGMECCPASQSGTTCEPSTASRGAGALTSCAEASRAKTYPAQGMAPGSTEREAVCGEKWRELLVRYDRASSSWKTHLCLWDEDLPWCSVTLPRWGMMRDGVCWERTIAVDLISATDAGSMPTPTATDYKRTPMKMEYATRPDSLGVPDDLAKWAVRQSGLSHARLVPDLWEWAMAWPEAWTESKPVEMAKFQQWLSSHGIRCQHEE